MSQSQEYWEKHILSWEESAYHKSYARKTHLSFWDRLSILFRGDMMVQRMNLALDSLGPLHGQTVLDVGCASGRFALRLLEAGAAQVTGVDAVATVIEIANQNRQASPYAEKLAFLQADVTQAGLHLPAVDLTTALGVLEYFDAEAMAVFLKNLKTRYFFFDFPHTEKRTGLLANSFWTLRRIYLKYNRCPGIYFYTLPEFTGIAAAAGFTGVRLIARSGFYFVTNLPQETEARA
jgi:SAM-dependent methyltransferase